MTPQQVLDLMDAAGLRKTKYTVGYHRLVHGAMKKERDACVDILADYLNHEATGEARQACIEIIYRIQSRED